jgi:hypothetical protein
MHAWNGSADEKGERRASGAGQPFLYRSGEPMPRDYLPRADSALLMWGTNFSDKVQALGAAVGLSPEIVATLMQRQTAFAAAMAVTTEPATRTGPAVAAKDASRAAFESFARICARLVQATPGVTDAQRIALGLTVRKEPSRVPPPTQRPSVQVTGVVGRCVSLRVYDGTSQSKRRRAIGSIGAKLYVHAGEQWPSDLSAWHYWGDCTRDTCDIEVSPTVAGGQRVWITAVWYTRRGETGPMANPIMTYLQGGGTTTLPASQAA